MHLSPLKKIIIASCILLTITGVLLFIFAIISKNIRHYHETLQITAGRIITNEKHFEYMKKIYDLIKNKNQDIQRIERIAINHQRPLVFIETIEQISRTTGTKMTLTVNEIPDDAQALMFRTSFEGGETNIRRILALIQQLPYQIHIESISFQRDTPLNTASRQNTLPLTTHLLLAMKIKTL